MPMHFGILELSLAAGSFGLGLLSGRLSAYFFRKAKQAAAENGPVTLKVKGIREPLVIPEHYNSAAVDKILSQMEIA